MLKIQEKLLYLDQNIWIKLGRIHYGIDSDSELEEVLNLIQDLIKKKKLIVPLSHSNFIETTKRQDKVSRERLAKFMIFLSNGYSFSPYVFLTSIEVENLIRRRIGEKEINMYEYALGVGLPFLVGEEPTPRITTDKIPKAEKEKLEKYMKDKLYTKEIVEYMILNYTADLKKDKDIFDDMISGIESEKDKEMKIKDKTLRKRFRIARYLIQMFTPKLAEKCMKYKIHPQKIIPKNPNFEQIMEIFEEMPLVYTNFCLIQGQRMNPSRPIVVNDLFDIAGLSFAIPYMDYVVGERFFLSIAKRDKLDHKYDTVLFNQSELTQLKGYLDKL